MVHGPDAGRGLPVMSTQLPFESTGKPRVFQFSVIPLIPPDTKGVVKVKGSVYEGKTVVMQLENPKLGTCVDVYVEEATAGVIVLITFKKFG